MAFSGEALTNRGFQPDSGQGFVATVGDPSEGKVVAGVGVVDGRPILFAKISRLVDLKTGAVISEAKGGTLVQELGATPDHVASATTVLEEKAG